MRALVLGGCGFIGSHLVDDLLAAGHKVRVVDRASDAFRLPVPGVEYRIGNFTDLPFLAEALEGIDVVYHLISTTVPSTSNLDPIEDVNGNLINTLSLLRLMVQKNISKLVFLSSGGTVYGVPDSVPISESHPLRPICSYGVVKVAIENYLHMFSNLYGLQYVALRASNPYGERQGHVNVQGVIGTFMNKIYAGEPLRVWGDGNVVRDYIYVKDLTHLCVLAGEAEITGVFNAGSGKGESVNELIAALRTILDKPIDVVREAGRKYDVPKVILDITQARETFGWVPQVDLVSGLRLSWQWLATSKVEHSHISGGA